MPSSFHIHISEKRLKVLDIQGSIYILYDPEIVTTDLMEKSDTSHGVYFCAGNLSTMSIESFADNHVCNKFRKMMELQSLKSH